jgi:hypothetical protein
MKRRRRNVLIRFGDVGHRNERPIVHDRGVVDRDRQSIRVLIAAHVCPVSDASLYRLCRPQSPINAALPPLPSVIGWPGGLGDHLMTWSAPATSVRGRARPSALAVLRLTLSARSAACSMGRFAGRAPLKMRST